MENKSIKYLLEKLQSGTLDSREEEAVKLWLHDLNMKGDSGVSDEELEEVNNEMWLAIQSRRQQKRSVKLWPRIAAAASIIICIGFAIHFYSSSPSKKVHEYASDIKPGDNKAYLILADGKRIPLNDAANGEIAVQNGVKISKVSAGELVYEVPATKMDNTQINTVETPRGGQFQVRLPDGTKVWLNAASSLKYPASFANVAKRKVELNGEAYFEVAKDKEHPFIVETNKQEVEVLGTHFNINCYADEPTTQTTLLEGSVKVSTNSKDFRILKPGEQSSISNADISVTQVNTDEATAWKNGYFMFNNESQEMVMRKLARWYDVEVEYVDPSTRNIKYYGIVSRFENISKVLNKLEQTSDVRFDIIGKKIKVYKQENKK